jgi:hypothetical protein
MTALLEHFIRTLPNKSEESASNELLGLLKTMKNPPQPLPPLTDVAMNDAQERVKAAHAAQ